MEQAAECKHAKERKPTAAGPVRKLERQRGGGCPGDEWKFDLAHPPSRAFYSYTLASPDVGVTL